MADPDRNDTSSVHILVLGGRGFIGRHAVAALRAHDVQVVIGSRSAADGEGDEPQANIRFEGMTNPSDWLAVLERYDVVLNCVGILRPRGAASYEKVHHMAPAALAQACAQLDKRLVHVSALGLDNNHRSGFLTSKTNGEAAIKASAANWIIARPSLLDGEGGYGAAWLRGVARLPFFVVPWDATGQIAALTVTDLGEALARLCLRDEDQLKLAESREFELGGDQTFTFEEYIRGLRLRGTAHRALCIKIPGLLARLGAHVCDLLYATPFSFGHWELLRRDNLAIPNRLPELLGRAPTKVVDCPLRQQDNT